MGVNIECNLSIPKLYINGEYMGLMKSSNYENDGKEKKCEIDLYEKNNIENDYTIDGLDKLINELKNKMFEEMGCEGLMSKTFGGMTCKEYEKLMEEAGKRLVDIMGRNKINENPLDDICKENIKNVEVSRVNIGELFIDGKSLGTYNMEKEGDNYKFKDVDMNKIHNLKCNKDSNVCDMFLKLNEEYNEVLNAYAKFDKENLIEELLDVVQMCYGVAYSIDVDLDNHIKEHNEKLLNRGHEFCK